VVTVLAGRLGLRVKPKDTTIDVLRVALDLPWLTEVHATPDAAFIVLAYGEGEKATVLDSVVLALDPVAEEISHTWLALDATTVALLPDGVRCVTCGDHLRCGRCAPTATEIVRAALVELAVAVEFHTQWAGVSDRARKALNDAWARVDPDGELRAKARQECGCADCDGPVELGDELCDDCAGCTCNSGAGRHHVPCSVHE